MANNFRFDIDIRTNSFGIDKAKQELQQLKLIMDQVEKDPASVKVDSSTVDSARARIELLEKSIREAEEEGKDFGQVLSRNMREAEIATERTAREVKQLNNALKQVRAASLNSSAGLREISKSAKLATQNIKSTTEYMDRLKNNMLEGFGQTVAFGSIMAITTAVSEAVQTVTQLDKVMTQISIVSGKSADEMEAYRDAAGEAASVLGSNAKEFMQASLIYEQQGGLAQTYAQQLGRATVIGANIDDTGKNADEISEYITAVMNGFEMLETKGGDSGMYIMDVLSRLGSVSGSALNEMSEGLQRVSNLARTSGYEFEEISAAIATVSETTRRSASTIGNAFKSILVSFQQVREGSDEEIEEFTSKIQKAFNSAGLDIKIFEGDELREAAQIMDEVGAKWDSMDAMQRAQVSEAIAGKYHAETFQAFMENQERYHQLTEEAYNSEGTAMQQQLIYMDSIQAKVEELKNAWQGAASAVIDTDIFKNMIDSGTALLNMIGGIENGLVAVGGALAPVAGAFMALFGGRIAQSSAQNKMAKDFTQSIIRDLEKKGQMNDLLREELSLGERQQVIARNLGEHAGNIFKQNVENLKTLKEQEEAMSNIKDTIDNTTMEKFNSFKEGNFSKTPSGIESKPLFDAMKQAENEAYKEKDNAGLMRQLSSLQEINKEYVSIKRLAESKLATTTSEQGVMAVSTENLRRIQSFLVENNSTLTVSKKLMDQIQDVLDENEVTAEQYDEIIMKTNREIKSRIEPLKKQTDELKMQTEELVKQKREAAALDNIRSQIESQNPESSAEDLQAVRNEINTTTAMMEIQEEASKKSQKLRRSIEGIGRASMFAVPLILSLKGAFDGTMTSGEAAKTVLGTIGMTLMTIPHPIGKVVGGITMLVSVFADFTDASERLKNANEDILRSYMSLSETAEKNIAATRGLKDAYNEVLSYQKNAVEILSSGTDEQKEAYKQLAESIAATSPELVKYYDAEGQAVIDLSNNYDTLYAKKQSEVDQNKQILANNKNSFITQYSNELLANKTIIAENSKELDNLQQKIAGAKKVGDTGAVAAHLKEMQKLTAETTESLTATNDTRDAIYNNVIRPMIDLNEEIRHFSELGEEGIAFANKLYEVSDTVLDRNLATSLIEKGDIETLEQYEAILDGITDKIRQNIEVSESKDGVKSYSSKLVEEIQNEINEDPLKFSIAVTLSDGSFEEFERLFNSGESGYDQLSDAISNNLRVAKESYEELVDTTEGSTAKIQEATGTTKGLLAGLGTAFMGPLVSGTAMFASQETGFKKSAKQIKEMNKAVIDAANDQEALYTAFSQSTKSLEGFNAGVREIKNLKEAEDSLGRIIAALGNGRDYAEAFNGVQPEMLAHWKDEANRLGVTLEQYLPEALEDARNKHDGFIAAMMGDNAEYYLHWQEANGHAVKVIGEDYKLDAQNYSTLTQLKEAMMAMDAHEFSKYTAGKISGSAEANEEMQKHNNTYSRHLTDSVNNWLDNFDWFQSESLSVGDKIKLAFLMVADGISLAFASIGNTIVEMFRKVKVLAYETVSSLVGSLTDNIPDKIAEKLGLDGIKDHFDKGAEHIKNKGPKFKGSNLAGDFASSTASNNETKKKKAIEELYYGTDHSKALESYAGSDYQNLTFDKVNGSVPSPSEIGGGKGSGTEEGKGKGGSDKDKDKDKKDVENLKLELDRYYKLNDALAMVEDRLKAISRAKENAYGDKKLGAMDREQAQYAAQIKILQQYQKELGKEAQEKRNLLKSNGFNFDKNGEIVNLNQRLTAMQNAANKLTGDAKEKAIERVKEVQQEAERYLDLQFSLIPDKKEAIAAAKDTIKAVQREKIEYRMSVVVEKQEAIDEFRELIETLNGDKYNKLDENMLLSKGQLDDSLTMYRFYRSELSRIKKDKNLTADDRQELLAETTSNMYKSLKDAQTAYEKLSEIQMKFIEESSEMIETILDGFDKIADKASTLGDIFAKVYGSSKYKETYDLRNAEIKAIDAQITGTKKSIKELKDYQKTLKKGSEEWEAIGETIDELGDKIENSLTRKIEVLTDRFTEFMDSVLNNMDKKLFGGEGLEGLVGSYDRIIESQDKYLNGFEKISEVGALISKVNESIASTDDPEAISRYNKFKEQNLNTLMKASKVSEAELERAEKLWDIELKKQALEERQNIKRQAQLVRDQNGNMSYEYTTTSEKSKEGASELAKANKDLYDFDIEQAKAAQKKILDVVDATNQKIQDLYNDSTLTPAQRNAALKKLQEESLADLNEAQKDAIKWTGKALEDGMTTLKDAFTSGGISLESIGIKDEDAKVIFQALENGSVTVNDILNGNVKTLGNLLGKSVKDTKDITSTLVSAITGEVGSTTQMLISSSNAWSSEFKNTMGTLKNEYTKTQNDINKTTKELEKETGSLTVAIKDNSNAINKNIKVIGEQAATLEKTRREADKTTKSYNDLTDSLIGKGGKGGTLAALTKVRDEMANKMKVSLETTKTKVGNLSAAAGTSKTGATTTLNSMANAANNSYMKTKQFDSQTIKTANQNITNMSSYAKSAGDNVKSLGDKSVDSRSNIASLSVALAALPGLNNNKYHYYTVTKKDGSIVSERSKDKKSSLPAGTQYVGYFDTGGYTGEWTGSSGNQEGRPAMVHEKEIILNKEDTRNFLDGIMAQRDILSQFGGFGMSDIVNAMATGAPQGGNSQEVNIYPTFPNVTDSNQIVEAFDGMALRANTYANRTK